MFNVIEEFKKGWLMLAAAEELNWANGYSPLASYWAEEPESGR